MKQICYFLIPTLLLLSSCIVQQQKGRELFIDGKLPKILADLANPVPEGDPILSNKRLRIAVIDDGVDYMHPGLAKNISYTTDGEGKILGVGRDILGEDQWAHPTLFDAFLFSFGAEMKDEKMVSYHPNPVDVISKLNREFVNGVVQTIRETIPQTQFTKINSDNFSVFGAEFLMMDLKNEDLSLVSEPLTERNRRRVMDFNWGMHPESGLPDIFVDEYEGVSPLVDHLGRRDIKISFDLDLMRKVNGFSTFVEIVNSELEKFKNHSAYSQAVASSLNYVMSRKNVKNVYQGLKRVTYYELQDLWSRSQKKSFIHSFAKAFCLGLADEEYQKLRGNVLSGEEKKQLISVELERALQVTTRSAMYIAGSPKMPAHIKKEAFDKIDNLKKFKKFYKLYSGQKKVVDKLFCKGLVFYDYPESAHKKHPYLAGFYDGRATHGTHVAGIIAHQFNESAIYPIRIAVNSHEFSKSEDEKLKVEFISGLSSWLNKPEIANVVALLFSEFIESSEDAARQVIDLAREQLNEDFERVRGGIYFLRELKESIKHVGQEKIKIANISLGTLSERKTDDILADRDEELAQALEILHTEYHKYRIGELIEEYASGTLFVVASGNNGQWLDGKVRSALPCDISSPFLIEHGVVDAPNNRIENILCVGSVNSKKEISSFTNLPVTNVPFVLSYGEAIRSTVKVKNCDGITERSFKKIGGLLGRFYEFDADDEVSQEFVRDIDLPEKTKLADQIDLVNEKINAVLFLTDNMLGDVCEQADPSEFTDSMSGTSMAAPNVTGFLGRILWERMNLENIEEDQIYSHPDFSPGKIIQMLQDLAPSYGGSSILKNIRIVVDLKQLDRVIP